MECPNCGTMQPENANFCPGCGRKIIVEVDLTEQKTNTNFEGENEIHMSARETPSEKATLGKRIQKAIGDIWRRLSIFGKATTVSLVVVVLLGLVAWIAGKTAAIVISIVQLILVVASALIHKGIIRLDQKKLWLKWVVLLVAVFLSVMNIRSYSWGAGKVNSAHSPAAEEQSNSNHGTEIDWEKLTLSSLLPRPQSDTGEILYEDEDWLDLTIYGISKSEFLEYVDWCKNDYGFIIDSTYITDFYSAKNVEKYELLLLYDEEKEKLSISVNAFYGDEPTSSSTETGTSSDAPQIDDTAEDEIDYPDAQSLELALNNGAEVAGKIVRFEVIAYKPDSALGINCWAGEHLNFISEKELDVETGNVITGRITEEPSRVLDSWEIHYEVLSVGGEKSEHDTTVPTDSEEPTDTKEEKIVLTVNSGDLEGMKSIDAEETLREMGFAAFEYKTVETESELADGTICYVTITEWLFGNSTFSKGDQYNANSMVTLYTYKYSAPTAPPPVSYSTNDYETAKNGDSGVYAYKSRGKNYDQYWIIDLDEGYAYFFIHGNGDSTCERVKIDSGTLNDSLIVTYHDGGDKWSYNLHFKYVGQPTTLIMIDNDGFDYKYSTTNLSDALKIRDERRIIDY